MEWYTILSRD